MSETQLSIVPEKMDCDSFRVEHRPARIINSDGEIVLEAETGLSLLNRANILSRVDVSKETFSFPDGEEVVKIEGRHITNLKTDEKVAIVRKEKSLKRSLSPIRRPEWTIKKYGSGSEFDGGDTVCTIKGKGVGVFLNTEAWYLLPLKFVIESPDGDTIGRIRTGFGSTKSVTFEQDVEGKEIILLSTYELRYW